MSGKRLVKFSLCVLGLCLSVYYGWIFWNVIAGDPLANINHEDAVAESQSYQPPVTKVRKPAAKPRFDATNYTGSQACAECHTAVCDSYHSHPMARSVAKTIEASELEDYDSVTRFDALRSANFGVQFHYEVKKTPENVIHSEILSEVGGGELFRVDVPIEYSVGSGQRGRSYIINRDGKLYMSPITWYSEGKRWDLSPSYSKENKHFERRILDGCVFCHAGLANPDPVNEHTFGTPALIEESIGCERCHGAGSRHIEFHKFKTMATGKDPIVNPAKLEPSLRDSVCFQCHLQGVGRHPRYSKSEYQFEPGENIAATWAIFIRGSKVDNMNSTEAVGQSEQMLVSKCYNASDGKMGCISCHDPHQLPDKEHRQDFYNQRCMTCHADGLQNSCARKADSLPDGSSSTSCITCHMPKLPANDVPHTSQTDHRVPRFLSSGPIVGAESERPEVMIFGNESHIIPDAEVAFYRGLLMVQNAEGSGDRFMASRAIPSLQEWISEHSDDTRALGALGQAYWITKDFDSAKQTWQTALSIEPNSELLLLRLMILCHDTGRLSEGINYGRRLLKINPWHVEHHARLAHMLGQSGKLKEGIAEAEAALKIAPWDFQLRGWMAEALNIVGDTEGAETNRKLFEKLRPLDKK